ncbi:MAG: hypothetical protein NWE94_08280 [Candidatus Bathyarchaeota archaeon]|nr:hypothetical protein [Candidatus Bathyarchaeota archaeon]
MPIVRDSGKPYKRITGITSGNVAEISADSVANERSREYLAHIADIETRRAKALAEAYRLSLR